MLRDTTVYRAFLFRQGDICSGKKIRALAKIRGVNYLEAQEALRKEEKIFLAEGDAYGVRDALEQLLQFDVKYEIDPHIRMVTGEE